MYDLHEMSPAEVRHLREMAQAWATYGPAMRAKIALDGGMTWKRVNGADYLCRYRQDDNGKKRFTSLGRRSAETEATYREFISERDVARQAVMAGRDGIALAGRIAKAYKLARMPADKAEILRAFWRHGLDEYLMLLGGTALFAYELQTETLVPIELTRDDRMTFLYGGEVACTTEGVVEAYEDAVGSRAKVSRGETGIRIQADDAVGVEIMTRKFLLRRAGDREQEEVLQEALEMPALTSLAVARDAQLVEMTVPDLRAYALVSGVLGQNDNMSAERAKYAATLVRVRQADQFDPRQEAAFPDIGFDPNDQLRFRGP